MPRPRTGQYHRQRQPRRPRLAGASAFSPVSLVNGTITDNSAHTGGGVYRDPTASDAISVRNSIIAQNFVHISGSAPDVSGTFNSLGHNLIGESTGSSGFGASGDIVGTAADPVDAWLGPLRNNGGRTWTHALLWRSPAIDKGDNPDAPVTDQRGLLRVKDGDGNGSRIVDIGAFER